MKKQFEIAIIASGKTYEGVRSEFRRNSWVMNDQTVKIYIDLTATKRNMTKLEKEITKMSTVNLTKDR